MGYIGYSKSERAVYAEETLKFPKTRFKKFFKVDPSVLCSPSEWHHTSKNYNRTDYYCFYEYFLKRYWDGDLDATKKLLFCLHKTGRLSPQEFLEEIIGGYDEEVDVSVYSDCLKEIGIMEYKQANKRAALEKVAAKAREALEKEGFVRETLEFGKYNYFHQFFKNELFEYCLSKIDVDNKSLNKILLEVTNYHLCVSHKKTLLLLDDFRSKNALLNIYMNSVDQDKSYQACVDFRKNFILTDDVQLFMKELRETIFKKRVFYIANLNVCNVLMDRINFRKNITGEIVFYSSECDALKYLVVDLRNECSIMKRHYKNGL